MSAKIKISECRHRTLRCTRNNVCSTLRTIDPSSNQKVLCRMSESEAIGTLSVHRLFSIILIEVGSWQNVQHLGHQGHISTHLG